MNDNIRTHRPAVRAKQLVDVYNSEQHEPSLWSVISDQVMGDDLVFYVNREN
ncbi:MAG: hypothetical protein WBH20_00725 [Oceanisphaera sp.]|uniref:hypothetical protein n=1 Tax=Oceanisphaera sp. TaxID=1929979 RepID=UPI003C71FB52